MFDFDLFCGASAAEGEEAKVEVATGMTSEQFANTFFRPFMRRQLASASTPVNFEEFFVPFTTTLSLNWPLPADQVLVPGSEGEAGEVKLNPMFETHLRALENWSLGGAFQRAFPDLVGEEVRVREG